MKKLSGADVRRLLNLFFLKVGFKSCLFSRVRDHRPCLRLHFLVSLDSGSARHPCSYPSPVSGLLQRLRKSMVQFQFRDCTKLTSSWDWAATTRPHLGRWVRSSSGEARRAN